MSSGFISETQLEERRKKRQEDWEKVRQPDQPLQAPEEEYDPRSLYDRLQEQKVKKQQEYEEAHKLKNMIKGLDNDEVDFLDLVDRTKMEEEKKKNQEEAKEIQDFRNAVATLREQEMQERVRLETVKNEAAKRNAVSVSKKSSQTKLLAGAVKRKTSSKDSEANPEKVSKLESPSEIAAEPDQAQVTPPDAKKTSKDSESNEGSEESSSTKNECTDGPAQRKGQFVCIGVLPGLGNYEEMSDSEASSGSDSEEKAIPYHKFDLCGRKIKRKSSDEEDSS